MNRSADWLHQAQADLAQARLSAEAGHHEWACFASHQAVEKALKALHLQQGQQSWGHGLGRSYRELPEAVVEQLAAVVTDLEDRLRVLDALYIPTRPKVPPPTTSAACKVQTPSAMPVRSKVPWPPTTCKPPAASSACTPSAMPGGRWSELKQRLQQWPLAEAAVLTPAELEQRLKRVLEDVQPRHSSSNGGFQARSGWVHSAVMGVVCPCAR